MIVFSDSGEEAFVTDKGIFRFDQKKNRFFHDSTFASVHADSSRIISEINVDRSGNVWMQAGGEIGVALRQHDGTYRWHATPFRRCVDFGVWSIYPEDSGSVWFGGPDGLVRYDANVQKDYTVDFAALIRRVIVDPDSVIWDGANVSGMNRGEATTVLAYATNALRFEFSATSYDDPSANQFQYFLEDFDKSWSAWTKEKKKDYTNLSEGSYQFQVRAKNIYEHISAEEVYSFKILPPWYRTWWAYLFYLAVFALSVYGFIKYRTRQLEQKSRTLEKIVQQRTEEIRQQAEELETLDGIVKVINQEVALESVLKSLLQEGLRLFPQAEKASVLLFDHHASCFKFAAAAGYDLSLMKDISFAPEEMARRYAEESEEVESGVYIVRDLAQRYSQEKLNLFSIPKSVLAMTAIWDSKLEAYLVFDNLSDAEAFDHSDARKLNRFRSHAISAIAKAKMLQELQEKNAEIIKTQEQLIIQEKLASLGGLTAGIAHEIKNPLNFVNNFAELSIDLAKELREEISKLKG
ncbi:MAG: triple tyrosine motif-containing protein, partial [bacterium]